MKKRSFIIGNYLSLFIFSTAMLVAMTSCRDEKAKTDTIIIEKEVPKTNDGKGTTIKVNKDGIEFTKKDGD